MAEINPPVEVQSGRFKATATHDRFGLKVESWNDPKVVSFIVLGADHPDQIGFDVTEGTRLDTNGPATSTVSWEDGDYLIAVQRPEIQSALASLRAIHAWIVAGRPEGGPSFPA